MQIKQMSYEQWLRENPEAENEYVCPECKGEGRSECCECGSEIVCRECDGKGNWAYGAYQSQCERDRKLAEWFEVVNA